MYEFVVDETKGIATLGGHPLKQLAKFQIKANDPTEPVEVILHVMVDRVKVDVDYGTSCAKNSRMPLALFLKRFSMYTINSSGSTNSPL